VDFAANYRHARHQRIVNKHKICNLTDGDFATISYAKRTQMVAGLTMMFLPAAGPAIAKHPQATNRSQRTTFMSLHPELSDSAVYDNKPLLPDTFQHRGARRLHFLRKSAKTARVRVRDDTLG